MVVNRVLEECKGRTVVWVLNDVAAAGQFDRVLVMAEGRIVEQGPPDELAGKEGSTYHSFLHHL